MVEVLKPKMTLKASMTFDFISQFPKPLRPPKTLLRPSVLPSTFVLRTKLRHTLNTPLSPKSKEVRFRVCSASTSTSSSLASPATQDEDSASAQLFEKLKDAERERINKLEELERKANIQLERQLVLASDWSRTLLTMQGKLKGTEWDPENSHKIDYSEFLRLLSSNNVQFMEYSNYGQTVSDFLLMLYFEMLVYHNLNLCL
ncbi:hypothetical protein NMG60_11017053 [Bertholletia excelsa]